MANGNYWEKPQPNGYTGLLPNPNAPRAAPSARATVEAIRKAGGTPTQAQIDAALNELYAEQDASPTLGLPTASPSIQQASPFDPSIELDPAKRLLNMKGVVPDYNNIAAKVMPPTSPTTSSDPRRPVGTGMGAAGDMVDSVLGVMGSVIDQANAAEANDPMNILAKLRQQYGTYAYNGPSAQSMADREFNPQFAALDSAANATEGRYSKNAKNLAGLYSAYANDVLSGRAADQKNYAQGTKDINASYQGAQDNAAKNMGALSNEMTQQLALLGQNEAAPAVMQEKQKLLAQQQGQLSQAQGAAAALNTQLGSNAYAYDTAMHGVAKQAGINAQADLAGQLEDKMAGYDAQRLALQGSRGQALNNYDMMIQKLISEGNSGVGSQIDAAFKTIMGDRSQQADRELQQARLDLDLKKFQASQQPGQTDTSKMNPYDALTNRAMGAYADPQQASNATDILYQTGMLEPNAQNIKVLMNLLDENNPGWSNDPTNRAMAYDYFTRILNANKR